MFVGDESRSERGDGYFDDGRSNHFFIPVVPSELKEEMEPEVSVQSGGGRANVETAADVLLVT